MFRLKLIKFNQLLRLCRLIWESVSWCSVAGGEANVPYLYVA